jgi:hypothetical protein
MGRLMGCPQCTDPDGAECFPLYGIGPHTHRAGPVIGSTVPLPAEQWPEGYTEDPECPGMGTWWCPACGSGKPPNVRHERTPATRAKG